MRRRQAEQAVIEAAREVRFFSYCNGDMGPLNVALDDLDAVGLEPIAKAKSNSMLVTSQNAAAYMNGGRSKSVAARIIRELRHRWQTTDALCVYLQRPHQTVSARVNELRNAGWIEGAKITRPTRSGQEATVWKLTPRARSVIAGEE